MNLIQFADAMQKAYNKLTPYEKAVVHLRAAAAWTNKELENPIIARACRDCAVRGLQELGETIKP